MSGFISYERDFDALKLLVDAAKNAGVPQEVAKLYDYIVKKTTVKKYASTDYRKSLKAFISKRFVPKDPDAPPAGARIVEDLSTATPGALTYPVSTYVPGGPHVANAAVGADAAEEEELTPQHTFVVEFYPGYRNKVKVTKSVMGRAVARVPAPTHYGSVREGYQDASSHPFGVSLGTRLFSVEERGPEAAQAMAHEDALVILGFKKVYEGQLERIADEEMRARVLAAHAELAARRTLRSPVKHGALRSAAPGLGPVRRRGDGYQVKVQRKGHDHWVDATDVDAINNASERAVAGFGSKHLSRLRNAETTKALDSGEVSFPEATNSWRRRESIGTVFRPDALANVDDVDDGDDECASASSPAGPGAALELAKQSAESRGDMAAVSPPRTRSRGARADDVAPTLDDDAADAPSVESSAKSDAAEPPQDGEGDARNPSPLSAIDALAAALVAGGVSLDAAGTVELILGSLEASGWSLVSSNVPRGRWDDLDFGASSDDDVCFKNLLPFLGEGASRWTDTTLPDEEADCYDSLTDYLSSAGVDFIRPSFAPPAPPTELYGIARGSRASAALLDAEARRRLGSTFEFEALQDMVNDLAFEQSDVGKRLVELRLGLRATQPLVWDELRPMWCLAYLLEGEQATAAGLVLRPVTFQLSWAGMQNLPEIVKYYGSARFARVSDSVLDATKERTSDERANG